MYRKLQLSRFLVAFSFLFLLNTPCSFAQSGENPFDIGKPITSLTDSLLTAENDENVKKTLASDNPFDIVATKNTSPTTEIITPKATPIPIHQVTNREKPQGFLFGLVITLLLLLTILVSISRNLISKIYQAFFNDIVLKMLHRERGSLNTSIYFFLYAMFIINFGVFIYLILRNFGFLFYKSDFITLLYSVLGIAALIISKHIILAVLSYVFPISKEIDIYAFIILIFGILIGLILAPVNVFFAYSDPSFAHYIIIGTISTMLLIYGLRAVRSLFLVRNFIFPHFFHFLLYLCSVEIVPLLLLFKLINSKLQIPIL